MRGAPLEGHLIEKVVITPSRIAITGIKSELLRLEELVTEPIDITNIDQSKVTEARLMVDDISTEDLSTDVVKVQLQVGDSKINKRFNNIPVEVVGSEFITKANSLSRDTLRFSARITLCSISFLSMKKNSLIFLKVKINIYSS